MRVKVTKTLIADNDKTFRIGSDIAFDYNKTRYIAEVADIGERSFTGKRILENKVDVNGTMMFEFNKVSNCEHVYYD